MSQQQHTQEPVAMIHAEWLERSMIIGAQEAAAELRRLHEVEKQRDTLLAALESISKITYDAGFNIGGPLEHCPGNIGHDEAKRLLSLACEYLKDTSKAAHRAITSVKGGAA